MLTGHWLSPFWKDLLPPHEERDSAGRAQAGMQETGALLPVLPLPRTTPGNSLPLFLPWASWTPAASHCSACPVKGSCSPPGLVTAALAEELPPAASAAPLPANCIRSACASVHALNSIHMSQAHRTGSSAWLATLCSRHTRASDPRLPPPTHPLNFAGHAKQSREPAAMQAARSEPRDSPRPLQTLLLQIPVDK